MAIEQFSPDEGSYNPVLVTCNEWWTLSRWGKETNGLNPWERKFAFSMGIGARNGWTLSDKQRDHARKILYKARAGGFAFEPHRNVA